MYGERKYGLPKKAEIPVESVPTFVCPRCSKVTPVNTPHIEITALEKSQLFMYTKLCGACAKLLQEWMKK